MRAPITRPSNVPNMLLAGRYLYTDFPGAPPVEVEVAWELGTCFVRFPPMDGDEGAEVRFQDMDAAENWRAHFERVSH